MVLGRPLLCLAAILTLLPSPAARPTDISAPPEAPYLYVVSRPLGARILLDDRPLDRPSPLLLRNLEPGKHRLRFEKEGRHARELTVLVPGDTVAEAALVPTEPALYPDGFLEVDAGGGSAGDAVVLFSRSDLVLSAEESGVRAVPVFPKQKLLDGVRFALPLFLGLTGVLTVREIYAPRDSAFLLAPELAASALIGGGLLGWNMVLEGRRRNFLRDTPVRRESWERLSLTARLRFERAREALLGGNFEAAQEQFAALVSQYPDDPLMPHALFEMGRILFILGDVRGSEAAYRAVAEEYPLPELHDRARKGIADCLLALGDRAGAARELELLTYNGFGLTREEVRLYRESL